MKDSLKETQRSIERQEKERISKAKTQSQRSVWLQIEPHMPLLTRIWENMDVEKQLIKIKNEVWGAGEISHSKRVSENHGWSRKSSNDHDQWVFSTVLYFSWKHVGLVSEEVSDYEYEQYEAVLTSSHRLRVVLSLDTKTKRIILEVDSSNYKGSDKIEFTEDQYNNPKGFVRFVEHNPITVTRWVKDQLNIDCIARGALEKSLPLYSGTAAEARKEIDKWEKEQNSSPPKQQQDSETHWWALAAFFVFVVWVVTSFGS